MKITVNGKRHILGARLGLMSCKIGFEKACELAGIKNELAANVSYRHKDGTDGNLTPGLKCVARGGTSFSVTPAVADVKDEKE